ncbi:hypothetical protein D3C85_868770 [compost metagenome]
MLQEVQCQSLGVFVVQIAKLEVGESLTQPNTARDFHHTLGQFHGWLLSGLPKCSLAYIHRT